MKANKKLAALMLLALVGSASAEAGLRLGPRIGAQVNHMVFNRDVIEESNRTGLTAGLVLDYKSDMGFGFDIGAMYSRRSGKIPTLSNIIFDKPTNSETKVAGGDYIEVPVNIKYTLPVPAIAPYIATGPSIAFLASEQAALEAYEQKKFDAAWQVGCGIELLDHLQVGFTYGWGITKALKSKLGWGADNELINGRNNHYTVTATWLF